MSSDILTSFSYLFFIIAGGIEVYSAYLALSVRRGLVVSIYRSRALWMGMLSIALIAGTIATADPPLFLYVGPFTLFVLFYWLDRTMGTISRLDYRRRDLLGWRKIRFLVGPSFLLYYYPIYSLFSASAAYNILLIFPLGYTSVALIVGSRRTQDKTFRTHAKWFGIGLATIILTALSISSGSLLLQSLTTIPGSYCFYRMARSLVPVGKLSSI